MESLVANYASSDEEQDPKPSPSLSSTSTSSFFGSLPKPSSSSLFSSLPKPKPQTSLSSTTSLRADQQESPNHTSILFSSLLQPKSEKPQQPIPEASKPKRVVQIRAPVNPFARKSVQLDEDDDDGEEEEKDRKRKDESEILAQAPSVKSFLSSIPAPRNSASLGALPSFGSGRRAIIETDVPASSFGSVENHQASAVVDHNVENYRNYEGNYLAYADYEQGDQNAGSYVNYGENYGTYESGVVDQNSAGVDYGHYVNNWIDRSTAMAPELSAVSKRELRVSGKRRNIPTEIVEVKQDELMKNRPREDQAKLTGIAFGPSYQPASSSKGKPSKLHKRKHQIGTLYFDMKQKEMELSERRAKGFLTKAETQAKYGW